MENSLPFLEVVRFAIFGVTLCTPILSRRLGVVFWTVFVGCLIVYIPVAFLDTSDTPPIQAFTEPLIAGLLYGGIACLIFMFKRKITGND